MILLLSISAIIYFQLGPGMPGFNAYRHNRYQTTDVSAEVCFEKCQKMDNSLSLEYYTGGRYKNICNCNWSNNSTGTSLMKEALSDYYEFICLFPLWMNWKLREMKEAQPLVIKAIKYFAWFHFTFIFLKNYQLHILCENTCACIYFMSCLLPYPCQVSVLILVLFDGRINVVKSNVSSFIILLW